MPLLSLQHLVVLFHALGVLLAVPSLASLGLAGVVRGTAAVSGRGAMPGMTRHSDIVIILLGGITWLLGSLAYVLASIGRFAVRALAFAGAIGLVLATALFVTAHGLAIHAPWARASATVLTGLVFVAALGATLLLRRKLRLASVLVAATCGLVLHALWVGASA